MKIRIIISCLTILPIFPLSAQLFQEHYQHKQDSVFDSGILYFGIDGGAWFYNNEYFNPYYKGYTLTGQRFIPTLSYNINSQLAISAGAELSRNNGKNISTNLNPFFNLKFIPGKNFSVTMGSYYGGENHKLPEALFSFENQLNEIVENGVRISFIKSYFETENWINWESFILPGDTVQEKFTAGSSNRIRIFDTDKWMVELPLYLLAHHSGGQINITDKPVETLINIGEGITFNRKFRAGSQNKLYAKFLILHSMGDFPTDGGIALSPAIGVKLGNLEANTGIFLAEDFINFSGNPLLRSWNMSYPDSSPLIYGGQQEIYTFKAGYSLNVGQSSYLFLRFETYYFSEIKKFDYSYSLHIQVNELLKVCNLLK
jgi:hypothetical protein